MSSLPTRAINKIRRELRKRKEFTQMIEIRLDGETASIDVYSEGCKLLAGCVRFVREFSASKARHYIYAPKDHSLDANQMLEVCMLLVSSDYDYVVVSGGLEDYPTVSGSCIEDCLIHAEKLDLERIRGGRTPLCGRLLRLPGYRVTGDTLNLEEVFGSAVSLQEEFKLVSIGCPYPAYHPYETVVRRKREKKMVFVVPVFMAVGGVERNTIEIMRALKDRYDFCVITLERHTKGQGSLHYQLEGLAEACFDLREITEFENYMQQLRTLKEIYQPDVVWLCNNSPWLEEHMDEFRDLFATQRMIAQDVYDTDYGWIEYYKNPSMQKMDGYIAVNERIKSVFLERYKLPEEKISVIYSAIDDAKIRKALEENKSKEEVCGKYGLDLAKRYVALIGRMTEQKDPLRYLSMIEEVADRAKNTCFLLVGDGNLSDRVNAYIEEKNLSGRVKRILFADNTPELISVLDGLVLTSVYEGLAIVSIEAMCVGTPILSTDTGDLKLFLDQTGGGMILSDSESDAEQYIRWMEQNEEYKRCAKERGARILDFFSAKQIAGQYVAIFEGTEEAS